MIFENLDPAVRKRPLKDVVRWLATRSPQGERPEPCPGRPYPAGPVAAGSLRIFWIGHSTLLIEAGNGPVILTDPVFSDRCSPLPFAGPKRFHPPGIGLDEIPVVDIVLISHNHYDHLDAWSVKELLKRNPKQPTFLVPRGLASWLSKLGAKQIVELGWLDCHAGNQWAATAVPAQHWSKRGLLATNTSWWCGYWLDFPNGKSVYFAGDSGYFNGFEMIRQRLGRPTVAALPIGAYEPRWFMQPVHMTPEEALRAFHDVEGETFLAIHHNTFRLSDEPPREPEARLRVAWERAGLDGDALWIPRPGDWRVF